MISEIRLFAIFFLLNSITISAQDGVGIGTLNPDPSAVLEIESNNRGLLIPRTQNIDLVASPSGNQAHGLITQDSATTEIFTYNQSINAWQSVFPRGGIIMWSGSPGNIPSGWALCDGNNGTPDLRGRFVVSYDNRSVSTPSIATNKEINYGQIGNTGGENTHVLTQSELASHTHTVQSNGTHTHSGTTEINGEHTHNVALLSINGLSRASGPLDQPTERLSANATTYTLAGDSRTADTRFVGQSSRNGDHDHAFSTNQRGNHSHVLFNTGDNESHENRPNYYVLAFIMKR